MSLRLRLVVALGFAVLVALGGANFAVYTAFRSSLISSLDATLDASTSPIQRLVRGDLPGPHGSGAGTPPPAQSGGPEPGEGATGVAGRLGASDSTPNRSSGRLLATPSSPPGTPAGLGASFCLRAGVELGAGTVIEIRSSSGAVVGGSACLGGASLTSAAAPTISATSAGSSGGSSVSSGRPVNFDAVSRDGTTPYRVAESLLPGDRLLVIAIPLKATNHSLAKLLAEELITSGVALLLAVALGFWLVRAGLRPLRSVESTANAITGGDLSQRVPGEESRTEVGNVARAINTMLRRIEHAFIQRDATEAALRSSEQRLRRFVADASHELRTPIAAVSAYSELFSTGAAEPERRADLERVMAGIKGESDRMGGLVEDLLLLARLDEGRPLDLRPVELVALCSDAIRTAAAVGSAWPVDLEASEPVELTGDPVKIRQVLDNLLFNVRAHTPPGTHSVVRVYVEGERGTIEVADDGPGFPPADLGRVFERFYRADPSRARQSGGSGLGLAIAASIIEGHGGTVAASNREPHGAVVRVTLPLSRS